MPMTIEASQATDDPASRPAAPSPQSADGSVGVLEGARVLLVEDEVFIAVDLQHALEAMGADVVYARTAVMASAALREGAFDAAVLDVTLGSRDTCSDIAAALLARGTPFVLHSGDLDRQGEIVANIDAPIVPKPAEPDDVVRRLAEAMVEAGRTRH